MMAGAEPVRFGFSKLHGAGNDFVLIDLRMPQHAPLAQAAAAQTPQWTALCKHLADRHKGIGCDQILTIHAPSNNAAIARYGIFNADGSRAGQCGNGARCVAAWLQPTLPEKSTQFVLESPAGLHPVWHLSGGDYQVDMGRPDFSPAAIGLHGVTQQDIYSVVIDNQTLTFAAVSMGNPHALLVVDDLANTDVAGIGKALQQHPLFTDSVNVGFAQVLSADCIALRVYERGAGETLACGSGACAAAVLLMRSGVLARTSTVQLAGGALRIHWADANATVLMAGPSAHVFDGQWQASATLQRDF